MATSAVSLDKLRPARPEDLDARIRAAKEKLGKRAIILGHHYQREEVYRHADVHGDSLMLSREAAQQDAEFIVFCGVHFMAEVADIMSRPEQVSILPDLAAGCSMADMADIAKVEQAWRELGQVLDPDESVTPVTYINSAADLKAFCGEHGGIVCTSSNATKILKWAFDRREKVLFFPDQHLGRWTGYQLGVPLEDMAIWDPDQPMGGLSPEEIRKARVLLWKGFCSVHQMFQPGHIDRWRAANPDGFVISHPESSFEVCLKSDFVGSTDFIIRTIKGAEPGTKWLVGTELNLVSRLAEEVKPEGKQVEFMSPMVCMCSTMFRIDPEHLAWALENLVEGKVVNQIKVPADEAELARVALQRMLDLS
ncbi:quinolinate synthase NadA [Thermithiobacillus plumbiphilus]|uniref:Quinolinate synthase n=1 Tax=Thermithiobacillus plumbiphilus TaxID=1729899 RepID=A0ABU9D4K5_9PROT